MSEFATLRDVKKEFSGVFALSGVSLTARRGEILALLGENGAGKSTLMNILSGTYPFGSYSGEIEIEGKPVEFNSPLDAERAGVTIIHQELSSFPHLTVAENLWIGHWPTRNGLVDWPLMESSAAEWLGKVGAQIDPQLEMGDLSTGSQQLVEIAKALARKSKLLILDEPTSSLTPKEVARLFDLLRTLKAQGTALVYISHKMEEIFAVCDFVTVLRDGRNVYSSKVSETDQATLISNMVGRPLDRLFPQSPDRSVQIAAAKPVLRVDGFKARALSGNRDIGPIQFQLKPGEILGFAGLLGAGRTELMQVVLGGLSERYKITEGTVELNGQPTTLAGPREALRAGVAIVGEDRKRDSIFAVRSLDENAAVSRLVSKFLGRIFNTDRELASSEHALKSLNTRYHSLDQEIRELSGGNQQKIVISRVLETQPQLLILDEPTRGVDVGAKYEIYQMLFEFAKSGKALIVISSDLPELMALSDRIVVLSEGIQTGELARKDFTQEKIMSLAIGASHETDRKAELEKRLEQ